MFRSIQAMLLGLEPLTFGESATRIREKPSARGLQDAPPDARVEPARDGGRGLQPGRVPRASGQGLPPRAEDLARALSLFRPHAASRGGSLPGIDKWGARTFCFCKNCGRQLKKQRRVHYKLKAFILECLAASAHISLTLGALKERGGPKEVTEGRGGSHRMKG